MNVYSIADALDNFLNRYVTFDGNTLTIDGASLRNNLAALLETAQDELGDNPTTDDVLDQLETIVANILDYDVSLADLLNETAIDRLKTQIETWIENGTDPLAALGSRLDSYLGEDGLLSFLRGEIVQTAAAERGVQATAVEVTNVFDDEGNVSLTQQLRTILPSIGNILGDEYITEEFRAGLDRIARDLLSRISLENGGDNFINIVVSGTTGTSRLGLYFTKLSEIGGETLQPIDASASTIENNLIVANVEGSSGEAIFGSTQRDVILVGDNDTVNGNGGGDLIILADGTVEMTINQSVTADDFLSNYVEASRFNDNHSRQTVELTTLSSASIVGFDTGWSIEGGSVDAITVDESALFDLDVNFKFDESGLTITDGAGSIFLASNDAAVLPTVNANALSDSRTPHSTVSVNFILNDQKSTALNKNQSIEANGAERYFLAADSTLFGFTGTAVINDYQLTTNGTLNVVGAERPNGWRVFDKVYGLSAGNTLVSALSDGSEPTSFVVNNDGTSISRTDTGREVWSGSALELAALNFIEIDYQEYYGGILTENIESWLDEYVSIDGGTLTVDLKSLKENLSERFLVDVRSRIDAHDEVTVDVIFDEMIAEFSDIVGFDVTEYLSTSALKFIRNQIETHVESGTDFPSTVVNAIDAESVMNFLRTQVDELINALGLQTAALGIPDLIESNDGVIEKLGLEPLLNQIFATRSARRMIHNVLADYRERFEETPLSKLVLSGDTSTVTSNILYGSSILDASTLRADSIILFGNTDAALNQSILGSSGNETLVAGAGDSVNGNGGNDLIVLADGESKITSRVRSIAASLSGNPLQIDAANFFDNHSRQTVELSTSGAASVVGFDTGFDSESDAIKVVDVNRLSLALDQNGLTLAEGNGSLLLAADDSVLLPSISSSATSDSRTPSSTVRADVLISDGNQTLKTSVVNEGCIARLDGSDLVFARSGATLLTPAETFSTVQSGGDIVLTADGETITLKGAATIEGISLARLREGGSLETDGTRDFVTLSSETGSTVRGFDAGFGANNDVVQLIGGNLDALTIEFTEGGLLIENNDGSLLLADLTSSIRADVLIDAGENPIKLTAVNSNQSIEAGGADQYLLGDQSTLIGLNGTALLNDALLSTDGSLNVFVEFDDEHDRNLIAEISGLAAGDTVSIAEFDGSRAGVYSVSADGTSIARIDTGAIVWSGTADALAEVDIWGLDSQEYYIDTFAAALDNFLARYVTFDGNTLNIDGASLRNNLAARLETARSELGDNPTADDVIDRLQTIVANVLDYDVFLVDILNENAIDRLKTQIETWIETGTDPIAALGAQIDSYLGDDGLLSFLRGEIVQTAASERGVQAAAVEVTNIFDDEGNVSLTQQLRTILPSIGNILDDEYITETFRIGLDRIARDMLARVSLENGGDNFINIVLSGTTGTSQLGLYFTKLSEIGGETLQPIDASGSSIENNLIVANIDGSTGESIFGSAQRDVILVGDNDTVNGNGGGDLIILADGAVEMTINQSVSADDFLSDYVEASKFNDAHSRQTVELTTGSSASIIGFETGWSIEGGDTDRIALDSLVGVTFDFEDDGLKVNLGSGSIFLASNDAAVLPTVNANAASDSRTPNSTVRADILINDRKVTALNSDQTLEANTGADYYNLPEGAALIGVTGTLDIDDCRFSTGGNLTVFGGTYTFADGSAYDFAACAIGCRAGDTISIGDLWSDPDAARVYRVSDDGTQIIRDADGTVVYEGEASTLASLNIGPITFADYFGGQIATGVNTFIDKYIAFDGNNLVIDAASLQSDLTRGIEDYRSELENASADVAVQHLGSVLADMLGINVSIDYLLSANVLDKLASMIENASNYGINPADAIVSELNKYGGGEGLKNWLVDKVIAPLQSELGTQALARGLIDIVDENGNLSLSRWIELARPLLSDQFTNEFTSAVLQTNLDRIGTGILDSLRADGGGTLDGAANVVFDGEPSAALGLYLTPFRDLASTDGNVLDASNSTLDNLIISNTAGDSVIGSSQNDTILIGNAATISGGAGNDSIVFADGNARQMIELGSDMNSTVVGFESTLDVINVSGGAANDLKIETVRGGLRAHNTGASWDEDGTLRLVGVDGDLLINDAKGQHSARVHGRGQTVTVGGEVELHYINDNSTVNATSAAAIVNGGSNVLLDGSSGNDTIYDNLELVDETVSNPDGNVTIRGGDGNDFIEHGGGRKVLIEGNEGDDTILSWNGEQTTVNAGAGNNYIQVDAGANVIVIDGGKDTVGGLSASDTISIAGAYSTVLSGNDLIVSIDGGSSAQLLGAASLDVNISTDESADESTAADVVGYIMRRTESGRAKLVEDYLSSAAVYGSAPTTYVSSETWTIQSADDFALSGVHYAPAFSTGKWVVLVHGYSGHHTQTQMFVDGYLANGYDVLAIDQRAAGESEGEWITMGAGESRDIALWTQEIARRVPNSRIVLHGVSMGAASIMLAAARDDCANLMAIVEESGFSSGYDTFARLVELFTSADTSLMPTLNAAMESLTGYALTEAAPLESIDEVTVPSIFIHGTADALVSPSNAASLYAASGAQEKRLYTVEGGTHGGSFLTDSVAYAANLFDFIDNNDGSGIIYSYLADRRIDGTDGADSIVNWATNTTIDAGAGDDLITLNGASWTVDAEETLAASGNGVSVDAGGGDNVVRLNHSYWSTIESGSGNDLVVVREGHYVNVRSGGGNDSILGSSENDARWTFGGYSNIDAGAGDDYINPIYSNNASIDAGAGADTIIVEGPDVTIGGLDNDLVTIDGENNVLILEAAATVDGFNGDDVLVFADARHDKTIEFVEEGLVVLTDSLVSPNVDDPERVLLKGINETTMLKLRAGNDGADEKFAMIADGDTYNASLGLGEGYVAPAHGGVNFGGVSEAIDVTLGYRFKNIDTIKGGDGSTKISGSSKDETILIGSGATTVVGSGGNDLIDGLKVGDAVVFDGTIESASENGALVINHADGVSTLRSSEGASFSVNGNTIVGAEGALLDGNSVIGTSGDDIINVSGDNLTIYGAGGSDQITIDGANNVIVLEEEATVDGFDGDDVLVFADARHDKTIEFVEEGLVVLTDSLVSPNVDDPERVLLKGINETTMLKLRAGNDGADEKFAMIADGDTYNASLGLGEGYVAPAHGGVNFGGVSEAIDVTLGYRFKNIDTIKGGDGSTKISGSSKDETILIGNGATTVNGGGGNDRIVGLKDGDFIIVDQNIVGSRTGGYGLLLDMDDGTLTLAGDSLRGGNSIMIAKGHTIVGDSGLEGIFVNDDGATIIAPNGIATLDDYVYTIAGDADGVSISGNTLTGIDAGASIIFGSNGEYFVNGTLMTLEAGAVLSMSEPLHGGTVTIDGGNRRFGVDEYGTIDATDDRILLDIESSSITVDVGAKTTIDAPYGVTVVNYDAATRSGFAVNDSLDFGNGTIILANDGWIEGLSSNEARLFDGENETLIAWTGSDGLIDRSDSKTPARLIATENFSTIISGLHRDTIEVRAEGTAIEYGHGHDTVLGFDGDDVLYQSTYADKKVDIYAEGLRFFDDKNSVLLAGVSGSTEITWRFGADETIRAAYVAGGEIYSVEGELANEYVGLVGNKGVDFSALEDVSIDASTMLEDIKAVTVGGGDSTFKGRGFNEAITFGDGSTTFEYSGGRDTIYAFEALLDDGSNDDAADRIEIGADFRVLTRGENLLVSVEGSNGKIVLDGMATVEGAIQIDDRPVKAGSTMTYAAGVTDYFGTKDATLKVEGDATIWLDSDEVNYANIKVIDASGSSGEVGFLSTERNEMFIGGSGSNTIAYALGDGFDTLAGLNDDDVIELMAIELDDIISVDVAGDLTTLKFSNNERLKIDSAADVTYEIGGASYSLDRETKTFNAK